MGCYSHGPPSRPSRVACHGGLSGWLRVIRSGRTAHARAAGWEVHDPGPGWTTQPARGHRHWATSGAPARALLRATPCAKVQSRLPVGVVTPHRAGLMATGEPCIVHACAGLHAGRSSVWFTRASRFLRRAAAPAHAWGRPVSTVARGASSFGRRGLSDCRWMLCFGCLSFVSALCPSQLGFAPACACLLIDHTLASTVNYLVGSFGFLLPV